MRCLVTGAGGFIGRHLCGALQERSGTVVAGLRAPGAGPWAQTLVHDLARTSPSPSDIAGVDCVIQLAGKAHALSESRQDEEVYFRVNAQATHDLLECCQGGGRPAVRVCQQRKGCW